MPTTEEYKKMLTEFVQKQMVVLGPNIALSKARMVSGLQVGDDGSVLGMSGEPEMIVKILVTEYMVLSGAITKMVLHSLLEKYPGIKGM